MYRLKVSFGRKSVIGVQIYNTFKEAADAKEKLIELGKAAGKKTRITIVDKFGAPVK